jgi:hypothetical protein
MFLQKNMNIKDRVTTSSKEQLRSPIRVREHDESLPKVARTKVLQRNIPEDWSVKDRTSCKKNLHLGREDDIVKMVQMKGAKCIKTWGPTGAKGRPNRARMSPGRPAWPTLGSVRPPISWAWRSFNPKYVEAPPFAEGEPFAREAVHKLEREKRREIICEKDHSTRRKQPQVEEDAEALPRHPRRRRKTPSEASPLSMVLCLAPWWGNVLICP